MIELYIEGKAVDISPDTNITLNFNSNLFGDISKIEASNSFTIALPKTPKNNSIFSLPAVVGGSSNAPYRRWRAQLFVNGVSVVDTAYALLLSVGADYEIALYWGVVTALLDFKDSDKTLRDIVEVLQMQYGGDNWWIDWNTKRGADGNILNALYQSGINNLPNNITARAEAALLPSVRGSWLWDSIVADNALSINAPDTFRSWLERVAVPFVAHDTRNGQSFNLEFTKSHTKFHTTEDTGGVTFDTPSNFPISAFFSVETVEVPIYLSLRKVKFESTVIKSNEKGRITATYRARGTVKNGCYSTLIVEHRNSEHSYYKRVTKGIGGGDFDVAQTVEASVVEGDYIVAYIEWYCPENNDLDGVNVTSSSADVTASYEEAEQVMGGMINTRDNLPEIKQLDFLKAVMAMQGMWATLADGVVHIQRISELYDGTRPTLDWSHKLVGSGDGDAQKTTYSLSNYAQRNIFNYKEDDSVSVDASGALIVENSTLEATKDMLILPFSASDGDTIAHLKYEDDKVKTERVQPRIMLLTEKEENGKIYASLNFDTYSGDMSVGSLRWGSLLADGYADWQRVVRTPIVIEERINLTEIDIKQLDFRNPIYLQKYGARFAVQKVQWSEGEASVVTLVYLPLKEDIQVATPYSVRSGAYLFTIVGGGVVLEPEWKTLVSGEGNYLNESATMRFDDSRAQSEFGISFYRWTDENGVVLSTTNPFVYDGSNGSVKIYAQVNEEF